MVVQYLAGSEELCYCSMEQLMLLLHRVFIFSMFSIFGSLRKFDLLIFCLCVFVVLFYIILFPFDFFYWCSHLFLLLLLFFHLVIGPLRTVACVEPSFDFFLYGKVPVRCVVVGGCIGMWVEGCTPKLTITTICSSSPVISIPWLTGHKILVNN